MDKCSTLICLLSSTELYLYNTVRSLLSVSQFSLEGIWKWPKFPYYEHCGHLMWGSPYWFVYRMGSGLTQEDQLCLPSAHRCRFESARVSRTFVPYGLNGFPIQFPASALLRKPKLTSTFNLEYQLPFFRVDYDDPNWTKASPQLRSVLKLIQSWLS